MLLVTLVLLVVLSILGYTLSSRVAAQRHRNQYIIDYQAACYGCDSAVKYALATLEDINTPQLVARPNEPDFSDLFNLSEAEYEQFLADWASKNDLHSSESFNPINDVNNVDDVNDFNDVNDANDINPNEIGITDFNEPNSLTVRGPYGPAWPFITKPAEFEIGSARVRIEIEDENAKYPVGWALLGDGDKKLKRKSLAGFGTFCEWMSIADEQIDLLIGQFEEIGEIKPFKLDFRPITIRKPRKRPKTRGNRRTRRFTTTKISVSEQLARQTTDCAKLFHSSLIDTDVLARPTVISESRKESALKYMGMWGSRKVNINTAPRHVLEAAFVFGGDEVEIAEEIIQRRRIKPFANIEDLRKSLFRYSDSIGKCEKYTTTASTFFTIKVTAVSGVAKASAVIAIKKGNKGMERIAVISG